MTQKKRVRNCLKHGVDCSKGVVHHPAWEEKKDKEFDIEEEIHRKYDLADRTVEHVDLVGDTEIDSPPVCDKSKVRDDDNEAFDILQFIPNEDNENCKDVIEKEKYGPQEIFSSSEASNNGNSEGEYDYPDTDAYLEKSENCIELNSIKGNKDSIPEEDESYGNNNEVMNTGYFDSSSLFLGSSTEICSS